MIIKLPKNYKNILGIFTSGAFLFILGCVLGFKVFGIIVHGKIAEVRHKYSFNFQLTTIIT